MDSGAGAWYKINPQAAAELHVPDAENLVAKLQMMYDTPRPRVHMTVENLLRDVIEFDRCFTEMEKAVV